MIFWNVDIVEDRKYFSTTHVKNLFPVKTKLLSTRELELIASANLLPVHYFDFPYPIILSFLKIFSKNLTTMEPLQQALDTDLIRSFQEGNQQALETLINRHKEKIFSSIFFLVKDKYLAEDLFRKYSLKW